MNGQVDPFAEFIDSLGSLPDALNIDLNALIQNQPPGARVHTWGDNLVHAANEGDLNGNSDAHPRDENVFDDLPYSASFPEDIDITAFHASPTI
ncbi:hypothetical protein TWF481_000153 [Arthrobotrys musiformis]|uniref:Uncharacterized protein n=1 Tax=Arthrobotrys musiformis TaxID=47236 RepID=A0AAV9WSH0_9PEZI